MENRGVGVVGLKAIKISNDLIPIPILNFALGKLLLSHFVGGQNVFTKA